jgi:hypothetical protein
LAVGPVRVKSDSARRSFVTIIDPTSDQLSQGLRLLMRGKVSTGQTLDLEAELAQPFLREVDLPALKGIFVAAAYEDRELTAIGPVKAAEIQPVALRLVIDHEPGSCCEVE